MNPLEYERFVEAARANRVLVEVDRAFAKRLYTKVPMDTIEGAIGEAPYFDKAIVCCALFTSPVALVGSIILAAFGLHWWIVLVAPAAVILWIVNRRRSAGTAAGIIPLTIALIACLAVHALGLLPNLWISGGMAVFMLALWCDRLLYVASTHFLRAQVLRNQRALEQYSEGLVIRNGSGG